MKDKTRNFKKRASKSGEPRKDSRSKRVNFDNTRESKFEKDLESLKRRKDSNDIRWYSKNASRITAVGRIPFAPINGLTTAGSALYTSVPTVPGVMSLVYTPNFLPGTSVIEQAYQNMYSDIVHANSRNQSYDYTDLAIMIQAGSELFTAIAAGIRAYGLMRVFTENNVYIPKTLVKAAGFKYDDLKTNYSHMWADILNLIAQSRQVWIPNTLPIIERKLWMNLHVFADSNSPTPQYYIFKQKWFYKFEAVQSSTGGKLIALEEFKDKTWSQYLEQVQSMIDALIIDQDRGIMYGDILKAYGREGIFAINDIALDYTTPITYNPEVLWQIENSTQCGGTRGVAEFTQNELKLQQHFAKGDRGSTYGAISANVKVLAPNDPMLNFHQMETPTPEQIMIATRMTVAGTTMVKGWTWDATNKKWTEGTSEDTAIPSVSGTEFITDVFMYARERARTGLYSDMEKRVEYLTVASSGANVMNFDSIFNYVAFDWAPMLYAYNTEDTPNYASNMKQAQLGPIGEYAQYSAISNPELVQLHNVAAASLYNMPLF